MYILYYIFGFRDKKYFTKREFKFEYVINFLKRNKEYRINGKREVSNEINTIGIDLYESCDDNIEKEEKENQNKIERKIEKKSEILSENNKSNNKINTINPNLNEDLIPNDKELKMKKKEKKFSEENLYNEYEDNRFDGYRSIYACPIGSTCSKTMCAKSFRYSWNRWVTIASMHKHINTHCKNGEFLKIPKFYWRKYKRFYCETCKKTAANSKKKKS